ncbi:hypothetical protein IPA_07935 [Ignicoccus pacificus DSM 13166]|uniref:Uncharacterized protein n=1 Tax=Ignicoccus pacificus DSM 13166 TaxID=940294 RepID=A0A977KCV7_9CREN|nr:hypothetical protein IPA_07935 [Ignicoccus pacificus DSM 13166]
MGVYVRDKVLYSLIGVIITLLFIVHTSTPAYPKVFQVKGPVAEIRVENGNVITVTGKPTLSNLTCKDFKAIVINNTLRLSLTNRTIEVKVSAYSFDDNCTRVAIAKGSEVEVLSTLSDEVIEKIKVKGVITAVKIYKDYVIIGTEKGKVYIYKLKRRPVSFTIS